MKNRLRKLRQRKGLTLKELGEKVGLKDNTISQYETGKREPKLETWIRLSKALQVPLPYLQGIKEAPALVLPKEENVQFGNKIKNIRLSLGKNLASFGEALTPPASASLVSRWERGVNLPNSRRIKSIAQIGGVSVNFLQGVNVSKNFNSKEITKIVFHKKLTDEQKIINLKILLKNVSETD